MQMIIKKSSSLLFNLTTSMIDLYASYNVLNAPLRSKTFFSSLLLA